MSRGISFNGNSLQTATIVSKEINDGAMPTRNVSIFALAHANASKVAYDSWPTKTITVRGQLKSDPNTISGVESLSDTFKGYLIGVEKNLDIDYAGGTRRYIATLNSMTTSRPNDLTYIEFSLEFVCSNPFGINVSSSTLLSVIGRTANSYADSLTVSGNAPWQRPIYTITLTAVTGATNQTIFIGNAANGQQISVTRTWAAGDVLVIDANLPRSVKVNGVDYDYSGAFPELAAGSQTINYTDSFTTRTFSYSITYNPMYL